MYFLSLFEITQCMANKLEKIKCNFLWSRGSEKIRLSFSTWETNCKPKFKGGLGVRKITDMNNVLLTKMGWNLMKENSNWWNIMKSKYLVNLKFSHYT